MQCKIFIGDDKGYLKQKLAADPIKLEDAINAFLVETFPDAEGALTQNKILQSQNGDSLTITIFY